MDLHWHIKPFSELTGAEVYHLLRLRSAVFVIEQNCVFEEIDGKDLQAWHVLGVTADSVLHACARILSSGVAYAEPSIGRVVTSPMVRRMGQGDVLMRSAIAFTQEKFHGQAIRIGAQKYLLRFYQRHGFVHTGKEYVEDGIPHMEMLLG